MSEPTAYSRVQIVLHWLIAILIVVAWFASEQMDVPPGEMPKGILIGGRPLHALLGISILLLVLIRIVVRGLHGAPAHLPMPRPMHLAAVWGHRLLYALMLAVPITGLLRFGAGIKALGDPHELLANALLIVALGHALAAIYHQAIMRDGTMLRMSMRRRG